MFPGFELAMIDVGDVALRVRHGGSGPPVLLLHGNPQTHVMWHKIAPRLAREFTVVAADLRGYGESSKPDSAPDHEPYSKRAMARDQVALMRRLGFERFAVVGHDRGARCAYRLAIDHPARVSRLAVLDIIPTYEALRRADLRFGMAYWHWFFLAQPFDLPERLIGADPDYYFKRPGRGDVRSRADLFDPEALEDYLRCFRDPRTLHAICEDYRAGATIDYAIDEADAGRRRIRCPLLALWSARGELARWYDVLAIWRDWATEVRGSAIDSGHYLAEEAPDETYAALSSFLSEDLPRR